MWSLSRLSIGHTIYRQNYLDRICPPTTHNEKPKEGPVDCRNLSTSGARDVCTQMANSFQVKFLPSKNVSISEERGYLHDNSGKYLQSNATVCSVFLYQPCLQSGNCAPWLQFIEKQASNGCSNWVHSDTNYRGHLQASASFRAFKMTTLNLSRSAFIVKLAQCFSSLQHPDDYDQQHIFG